MQMGLGSMEVYRDGFEEQFLASTASYYARSALDNAPASTLPEYLQMCDRQLGREQTRVGNYLHKETEEKLVRVVKREVCLVYANPSWRRCTFALLSCIERVSI